MCSWYACCLEVNCLALAAYAATPLEIIRVRDRAMRKFIGLLMTLVFSATLAPGTYAAVGMITEGRAVAVNYRTKEVFADYFSFNALSEELGNVASKGLTKSVDFGTAVFSPDAASSIPAFNSEAVPATADGTLQKTDNLFQINKKGLGSVASESGSITPTSTPRTETWTMIFVGAMLISYQLRRKQRGLMTPSLVLTDSPFADMSGH